MTNLDVLLLKGATSANPEENLRELRYAILTDGIPANSEGMVHLHANNRNMLDG
jgi:cell cycle arrest protein BUB2